MHPAVRHTHLARLNESTHTQTLGCGVGGKWCGGLDRRADLPSICLNLGGNERQGQAQTHTHPPPSFCSLSRLHVILLLFISSALVIVSPNDFPVRPFYQPRAAVNGVRGKTCRASFVWIAGSVKLWQICSGVETRGRNDFRDTTERVQAKCCLNALCAAGTNSGYNKQWIRGNS